VFAYRVSIDLEANSVMMLTFEKYAAGMRDIQKYQKK